MTASADTHPQRYDGAAPPRGRWFARFDTLRLKLFAAIAGANALLALLAFVVFSWSFDQGFVDYVNQADEARLQPLVTRLAEGYEREGSWRWIGDDRRQWAELMRDVFGAPRGMRHAEPGPRRTPGPPPDMMLTIDPRLLLFDADQRLLVGRDEMAREAVRKPISSAGQVVGYLGYVPRLKVAESIERAFSKQQRAQFTAIAGGMLLAGLLVGALLANWLTRRIHRLAQGTGALIQGRYQARVPVQGHDELDRLALDFNQLAHTLESAQRARQQWIADIAHELRTPLAVLRAEIEALQDGVRRLSIGSLASLAQEVGQLTRLVEDLRTLSLSDLGALSYHKRPLDFGAVIAECLAAQSDTLNLMGLTVTQDLPTGVHVQADASRLAQVFGNLLQNTLRYTDAPGRLDVTLRVVPQGASSKVAQVIWQDSAPGVPEAELPRLTDRLFRIEGSRSRAGGGSGLGLAITQAIVEAHDGEMRAAGSPLGGLRWTLSFPLAPAGGLGDG